MQVALRAKMRGNPRFVCGGLVQCRLRRATMLREKANVVMDPSGEPAKATLSMQVNAVRSKFKSCMGSA